MSRALLDAERSSPRTAIHVMPVAHKSWKVICLRVSVVAKSPGRFAPARSKCFRSERARTSSAGSQKHRAAPGGVVVRGSRSFLGFASELLEEEGAYLIVRVPPAR
jgi:hypothetical protein